MGSPGLCALDPVPQASMQGCVGAALDTQDSILRRLKGAVLAPVGPNPHVRGAAPQDSILVHRCMRGQCWTPRTQSVYTGQGGGNVGPCALSSLQGHKVELHWLKE